MNVCLQIHYALAWGNMQLFDFNSHMLSEKLSLHLWPMPHGLDETLNPLGIPGSNPEKDCPTLEVTLLVFLFSAMFYAPP